MFILSTISLIVILTLSILTTRIATIALTRTGLARESARFQARSAFTGVGFTTHESEKAVSHPVRRRILMLLMLLGNAGIVTAMASLLLTFVNVSSTMSLLARIVVLITGLVVLWSVASSQWLDRHLARIIHRALKRYTRLNVQDYAGLLHLSGEYQISELQVQPDDWLANRTLGELKLRDEGILVLGIARDPTTYLGTPTAKTEIVPGDTLIIYGRESAVKKLDQRRKDPQAEREHEEAVIRQEAVVSDQETDEQT
jgi:K+/H+ antiporter YhaU regulatory subunit KhtT